MALPALQHERISFVAPAATTIPEVLDAIHDQINAGSYWTAQKETSGPDTIAVYCTPVTDNLGLRIVFCGSSAAQTPTMRSPDSFQTNHVHIGVSKKVTGAYGAFDDPNPWADGVFFGFWGAFDVASIALTGVEVISSEETLWVYGRDAGGNVYSLGSAGALWSADSDDPLDAEDADGRLIGQMTSDVNTHTNNWPTNSSDNTWLHHFNFSGNAHAGHFIPGAAGIKTADLMHYGEQWTNSWLLRPSGKPVLLPLLYYNPNNPFEFTGRLRDVLAAPPAQHGQQLNDDTPAVVGEIVAPFTSSDDEALAYLT